MKKYKSTLTRGYCYYWTKAKAMIELVANGLDSDGEFSYTLDEENGVVTLSNKGVSVDKKVLLMGSSEKRVDRETIGRFGLGMKQALCVLASNDLGISIINGRVVWEPSFEMCNEYGEEVFTITEKTLPTDSGVFEIIVSGLSELDVEELKLRCLIFQEEPEVLFSSPSCDVLSHKRGHIYVSGIFVEEKPELAYGYNFDVNSLQLNQDRESVSSFNLHWETSEVWRQAPDDLLKDAVKRSIPEIQYMSSRGGYNRDINEEIAKEFFEENGEKYLAESLTEQKELKEKGIDSIFIGDPRLTEAIKSTNIYEEIEDKQELPEEKSPKDYIEELSELIFSEYDIPVGDSLDQMLGDLLERSEDWYA